VCISISTITNSTTKQSRTKVQQVVVEEVVVVVVVVVEVVVVEVVVHPKINTGAGGTIALGGGYVVGRTDLISSRTISSYCGIRDSGTP
jgi:hypothetical protein